VLAGLELTAGTTIVDCTTGEPEAMAAMGAKLAKVSIDYLDATVLGSSRVVRNGAAVVYGGRRLVFDAAVPLRNLRVACILFGITVRARG
jgi:3-hydroxyisobutyrate dehydrogenase-like beta-hydroxyacid dehydrogenase